MKSLKIGITGSNNTGKTTLSYELAATLRKNGNKADVAHESVKYCPQGVKDKTDIGSQVWIFGRQMQIEEVIAANEDIIICDKTAIDTYCYGKWAYLRNPTDDNHDKLYTLDKLTTYYSKTYDYLFLVPVNPEIHFNQWIKGVNHRDEIDNLIRERLKERKIGYIELKSPMKDRYSEILRILVKDKKIKC
jgi:nicotinamide riboside kinase